MNLSKLLLSAVCAAASLTVVAGAETITQFDAQITKKDPTQLGRLSRSGVPSDWSEQKDFPGVINAGTSYEYTTFDLSASEFAATPYVQISIYDEKSSGYNFLSAYSGSYNPLDPSQNYLGDAGSSPDYFGTDAVSFQVVLPYNTDLVLVLNDTHGGSYKGVPVNILVEGFVDTEFDDPAPIPEPSSLALLGTGLTGLIGLSRRLGRC